MNKDTKILITGASGFVGRNLVNKLERLEYTNLLTPSSKELNLINQQATNDYFDKNRPEVVLHIAGLVGGIAANKARPGDFFYNNVMVGINVMHYAHKHNAKKVVSLAAGCGYPKHLETPFDEKDFWSGLPDMNSYGYSMAKKNLVIQSWAYKEQFDFDSTVLIPANLYGPYDNFNLETSHVVPALIRKFITAKENNTPQVEVWGTGKATREFLYVSDAVDAIIDAIDVDEVGPFNLGTGRETSIKELIETISTIVGYEGEIYWNTDRPDGQPKRFYDMEKFAKRFGYVPDTSLELGLKETIDWYNNNLDIVRL